MGCPSHILFATIKVVETNKITVSNLIRIAVVVDLAIRLVEVLTGEGHPIVPFRGSVKSRSPGSSAGGTVSRHVVDHGINNHNHSGRVAPLNHRFKLPAVPGPGFNFIRDWLITCPPLAALYMFHWGRHLHSTESFWPKNLLTFISNPVPVPLEEMDDCLFLVIAV